MKYVDGFVLCVPKAKMNAYKKMAELGKKTWLKHGAIDYAECVAEDLKAPFSKSFTQLAKPKRGETVVFSYIVFKSRAHRDAVNKKVMSDPSMSPEKMKDMAMPFDPKRMAYGGFKAIVHR